MTNEQIHNVAAGFLHALQNSPPLFAEWTAVAPDDAAAYGAIVQRAMHLAAPPTVADIEAMDAYMHDHLKDQVTEFAKTHKFPTPVRLLCLMNQT